jgi:hypothetical protein
VFVKDDDRSFEEDIRRSHWDYAAFLREHPKVSETVAKDLFTARPPGSPETKLRIRRAVGSEFLMTVNAPRHTLIVSSETFWPGWRVESNGHRLAPMRVNGAFLGFIVPPGVSDVRVRYFPMSFYASAVVSLLTMIGLFVWCWRAGRPEGSGVRRP